MKQFILIILVLLPVCVFAQFNETFSGATLSPEWLGSRDSFIIVNSQLQLNTTKGFAGVVNLKRPIAYSPNMQWEFEVQMKTIPSENNYVRIYLYMENENTYYYVQIGCKEKEDKVQKKIGLRREGGIDMFERKENKLDNKTHLSIKVTLEDNKYWKMYSRNINDKYYKEEGSCTYPIKNIPESGYFIVNVIYTSSRNKHFLMDNIKVSDEITPTITDSDETTTEPDIPSFDKPFPNVEIVSLSELRFTFDSPVNISNAKVVISEIGEAANIIYGDNKTVVSAVFTDNLIPARTYTISFTGFTDLSGNLLNLPSEDFELKDEEDNDDENEITPSSILINEIMADPKGLEDLPQTEYVELYNPTNTNITLSDWQFSYGGKAKPMSTFILPANGYAVLYRSDSEIKMDPSAVQVPLDNFPYSLANDGKQILLLDASGTIIDEVTYPKATPAKSWERTPGGTWQLSTDPRGGTPGSANSSEGGEPVEPEEPVDPDDPEDPDTPSDPTIPVEPRELIINELLPNPFAGGSEYMELYNRSDHPLSLSGLAVATRKTDGTLSTRYPLSSVTAMIEPDHYALLTKNKAGVEDFYTIQSPASLFEIPKLPILANTTSTLVLFRTSDDTVIDEVSYTSKWHAPSIKDQKGVALERIDPEAETQSPSNWTSAAATAGYGTPGYQNSQSEISSPDDPTGIEAPEWVPGSDHYAITYYLDQPGYSCRAFVYNPLGQRVAELANHELLGLTGQFTWDGSSLSGKRLRTGVYIFYAELYHITGIVKRYKQVFLVR